MRNAFLTSRHHLIRNRNVFTGFVAIVSMIAVTAIGCGDTGTTTASCADQVKNGSETDVDCGGGSCKACADGQACAEGHYVGDVDMNRGTMVDAAHAWRLSRHTKDPMPTREDMARTVSLATMALLGGAIMGPVVLKNAGLGDTVEESTRFRRWLARLLSVYLDGREKT